LPKEVVDLLTLAVHKKRPESICQECCR